MSKYTDRLKDCYRHLVNNNIVVNKTVDAESIAQFQKYCNDALPTDAEADLKLVVRSMYYTNRNAFLSCIDKMPYLILLTEGRAITNQLKIENLIYIKWHDDKFQVEANSAPKYKPKQEFSNPRPLRKNTNTNAPRESMFNQLSKKIQEKEQSQTQPKQEENVNKMEKPDVDTFNSWADDY
jgi:hypothetical protein